LADPLLDHVDEGGDVVVRRLLARRHGADEIGVDHRRPFAAAR